MAYSSGTDHVVRVLASCEANPGTRFAKDVRFISPVRADGGCRAHDVQKSVDRQDVERARYRLGSDAHATSLMILEALRNAAWGIPVGGFVV